jgi:hypothetical protein
VPLSATTYMLKFSPFSTHYFTGNKVFKLYIHHFFSFSIVIELDCTRLARQIYNVIGVASFGKFLMHLQIRPSKGIFERQFGRCACLVYGYTHRCKCNFPLREVRNLLYSFFIFFCRRQNRQERILLNLLYTSDSV